MWTFVQSSGKMLRDGMLYGSGYSGFAAGKNEPKAQMVRDIGPIPQGNWKIEGSIYESSTHGPDTLRLVPCVGTQTFGRSGFLIHGDGIVDPGQASKGCIVINRLIRVRIWESGDRDLRVIADLPGCPEETNDANAIA